ncbi:hypothetical protein D3C81_1675990 [compost metagenome]
MPTANSMKASVTTTASRCQAAALASITSRRPARAANRPTTRISPRGEAWAFSEPSGSFSMVMVLPRCQPARQPSARAAMKAIQARGPKCGCWVLAHRPKPIAAVTSRGMTHSRCGRRVRLRRLRSRMMIRATPMPISGPMVCGDMTELPLRTPSA